ncbi:FAD-dependent oxidoreductase [Sphingobacterium shayense]|uniref:FAD-dependent oxidoreductase n=1 Tax=Sphingobacterium shayense TaxID=626343 RepID=UPI001553A9EA|nr:FAD-dependent oxidoreductase [Sphingobacterium shayense]NQD69672.1 FAD-dependent oxidoreductase [Sphingobacterium shayense]
MKRRSALAAMGAISLGLTSTNLLKGEVLQKPRSLKKETVNTDILVVGGGTAGVVAAIQAARAGKKTVLVENGSMLGGTTTTGGVNFPGIFFAWGKQVIGGIGWEMVQEAVALNNDQLPDFSIPHGRQHWKHQVRLNGPLYSMVIEDKCVEAGVGLRFYESPVSAVETKDGWKVITVGKSSQTEIFCNQLIDCTGNANVVSLAGYNLLREEEIQPGTLMFRIGGYQMDQLDMKMITAEFNQAVERGDLIKGEFLSVQSLLRNAGDNVQHIHGADATTSISHTLANVKGRASLFRTFKFLRGLPGLEKLKIMDMQNETATRESFRIDSIYKITHEDYVTGRVFEDAVSYSYYPIDLHDANGVVPKHLEQGMVATVPLRALIPAGSRNLIVAGRCVGSDRLANSALRVQASCMGMGQAAAAAAVLANTQRTTPDKVKISDIHQLLTEHGAIVPVKEA